MLPRTRALVGALAAVLLLALPAAAAAEDTFLAQTAGKVVRLSVQGSHGYRISVTNEGAKRRVILTAQKGDARAIYSVHGRATGDRIEGNFGKLGKISVRFQPSSQKPERGRIRKHCKGKPTTIQAGRFVGTIRFDGEEDFSSVATTSAKGTVVSKYKLICAETPRPPTARQSSKEKRVSFIYKDFVAAVADHDHSVFLQTVNTSLSDDPTPDGFTLGEAAMTEHRGRITIGRAADFVTEVDPVEASPLGVEPITATITLPAPLEGTGSYVENPGSPPSWTGDLSVRLPGGGVIPLTGPEFTAIFCHGPRRNEKFSNCDSKQSDLLFRGFRYPL
ncbi:MAG: hypothetical protein WBL45_10940 [Solirubrobacterales bacterium]